MRLEGTSNVYNAEDFTARVDFAAAVIARGGTQTRNFDTCFEMYDGHAVAEALRRRALTNPRLAANIWRYISQSLTNAPEAIAQYAHLSTRQLREAAAKERAEGQHRSEEAYKAARAKQQQATA